MSSGLLYGLCLSLFLSNVYGDCNYGVLSGFFPLAENECSYCDESTDDCADADFASMEVICASNGNSAQLVRYTDDNCTTEYNTTSLSDYVCDDGDDCSVVEIAVSDYDDEDCGGDANLEFYLYVAETTICEQFFGPYYIGYTYTSSGITFGFYNDSDCEENELSSGTFPSDCDNGTSIDFSSAYTNTISYKSSASVFGIILMTIYAILQ